MCICETMTLLQLFEQNKPRDQGHGFCEITKPEIVMRKYLNTIVIILLIARATLFK